MKNNHFYLLCLISALLTGACQSGPDNNSADEEQHTAAADTLTYEYKRYIKYSDKLIKTTETTDTSFFSVSYPLFQDSAVNRFVLSSLLGSDTTTVERAAQSFISEFDRFHGADPFPRVWTSESHAKVFRITPTYLSLIIDAASYTGGAHGNYATVFRHYDIPNDRSLAFEDFVSKMYQNELTAVAERHFRQQEGLEIDEPLDNRYFFDDGRFSLPDNFALEPDSMLFLYNIYEIKPYV